MKQSLEKRIILFSFIILSMTILANTAMEIAMFRREYVQEIILRSQSLGISLKSSMEKVLSLGIDIRDINGLAEKCREVIQTDPEMSYCVISDNNGKTLFASEPEFATYDFSKARTPSSYGDSRQRDVGVIKTPTGRYFDIRVPVHSFDSGTLASIHIGFPLNSVDQKVNTIILRSLIVFLIFFSISFALVILFVKRSIITPITKLLEGVTRIAQGEFKTTIETLPIYELDQLGNKINTMSVALEARDNELHNNYAELSNTHMQLHNSYLQLERMSSDLEKSEELYKKLQEEAGDTIIILDDSEKIIIVNKMAETFLGLPANELVGQHISNLLVRLNSENIPQLLKKLKEAYAGSPVDDEITISNSMHEQRVGRVHASCVSQGEKTLLQIIIRDVTKEREILQNLENSAAGLARLNRMKDSFLGLASHELKTPLTVIMGYSDLLLTDMKGQLTESTEEMVQNISAAAVRLDNIVKDMIDVSMIDQKRLELKLDQVDINALIESAVKELRFFLVLRKQEITTHLDTSLPIIRGDHTRLMQLLSNILGNAIKFTPDGGSISVTTALIQDDRHRPLHEVGSSGLNAYSSHRPFIEIVISDTGIGIDKEDQRRIFDKFYEAGNIEEHSSGKVAFKARGAGLGLSIAKGVIDMHGGHLWAESAGYDPQACPGSSFYILLPVEQSHS
ncbi:MAG: PAS domain S-box protein [Geobacteraceae bacterium]|nr:PAS domain S-box protein [Geobacteraceae bacterium]